MIPLLALAWAVVSCSSVGDDPEQEEDAPEVVAEYGSLPLNIAVGDCDPETTEVSADEWSAQAEDFVVGTIVEFRRVDGPWIQSIGGELTDSCANPVRHGVDIVLDDIQSVSGLTEATIRVTTVELRAWEAKPEFVESDMVEWTAGTEDRGVGYGMRVGGFVVRPEEADVYLTIGPLLWEGADRRLHFQHGQMFDECAGSVPTGVDARSFREVADSIRAAALLGTDTAAITDYASYIYMRSSSCGDNTTYDCVVFEPGDDTCPRGETCNEATGECVATE